MSAAPLAAVDVLDRDGQVRQTFVVHRWPVTIGRALDNDVVLADPYVATHHLTVDATAEGLAVETGRTQNGALVGGRRAAEGQRVVALPAPGVAARAEPPTAADIQIGRTRLRLRRPEHALAAELPLAAGSTLRRRIAAAALAAVALVVALVFTTWLESDPEGLGRAIGSALLAAGVGMAVWCGGWALLSKTFTRHAHLGWHVGVFLYASLALIAASVVPALLAFMFSWPVVADFAFVLTFAIGATAIYFHLLAVEPARKRLLRWVVATGALAGIALMLWFNVTRTDHYGEELYMSHLFPPALRLAKPVSDAALVQGLIDLKGTLDKKAKEPIPGDESGATRSSDVE